MPRPVLLTRNMRFFYAFHRFLKEHNIPVKVRKNSQYLSPRARVVFTTREELPRVPPGKKVIAATPPFTKAEFTNMIREFLLFQNGIEAVDLCKIGIDPGSKNVGVAIFADETLVEGKTLRPNQIRAFFEDLFAFYEAREYLVKIGLTRAWFFNLIASEILAAGPPPGTRFQRVDERATTRPKNNLFLDKYFSKTPDTIAAILIATKPSDHEIISASNLEAIIQAERTKSQWKKGEIKTIQKLSRTFTDGRFTISRALAKQVLAGDLSLQEALLLHER